jgi:hypothetical protein
MFLADHPYHYILFYLLNTTLYVSFFLILIGYY